MLGDHNHLAVVFRGIIITTTPQTRFEPKLDVEIATGNAERHVTFPPDPIQELIGLSLDLDPVATIDKNQRIPHGTSRKAWLSQGKPADGDECGMYCLSYSINNSNM